MLAFPVISQIILPKSPVKAIVPSRGHLRSWKFLFCEPEPWLVRFGEVRLNMTIQKDLIQAPDPRIRGKGKEGTEESGATNQEFGADLGGRG